MVCAGPSPGVCLLGTAAVPSPGGKHRLPEALLPVVGALLDLVSFGTDGGDFCRKAAGVPGPGVISWKGFGGRTLQQSGKGDWSLSMSQSMARVDGTPRWGVDHLRLALCPRAFPTCMLCARGCVPSWGGWSVSGRGLPGAPCGVQGRPGGGVRHVLLRT